ncbi:hypothetical protein [Pedobacter psychrodurus]|uniref:hypothetical protein n=1 Tax=Pedobacter psychrodurus TaxID=2530456 RepID=UPI00292CDF63|nr:hypothetical protein [Pedobacter psychrodurus]
MKKYILGTSAIVLAILGSAFTTLSTKSANEINNSRAVQTWFYTGNTLTDVNTASLYSATPPVTGCPELDPELPCEIRFEADDYSTPGHTPLENYLMATPAADVRDDAIEKKPIQ